MNVSMSFIISFAEHTCYVYTVFFYNLLGYVLGILPNTE
jgi:hypothetical protein